MADSTNKSTAPEGTKALAGSFEQRARDLGKALKDSGILPAGDVWVTDTFESAVVVSVWSRKGDPDDDEYYEYEQRYYKVEISAEGEGGFEFGAVTEVEKVYTETLAAVEKRSPLAPGAQPAASAPRSKAVSAFRLTKALTPVEDEIGGWEGEGCFSVFDYEDHSKDIVRRGSTKRSTAVHLPKILDHHGVTVGQSTKAYEDDEGLQVAFRIYPTRAGEDLAKLMRPIATDLGDHAPVEQGSIGFSVLEGGAKRRKSGGWEYTDLWIWEVSPVTFGDNDATTVGLKSMADVNKLATTELAGHAGDVLRLAVEGADGLKTLHTRRVKDGRDLSDAQHTAALALAIDSLEAAEALLALGARGGRKASNSGLRHIRGLVDSLAALVHGPSSPASTPAGESDDDEANKDTGKKAGTPALDAKAAGESPPADAEDAPEQPDGSDGDSDDSLNLEGGAKASAGGDEPRSKDLPSDDFDFELALVDLGLDDLGPATSQE